MTITITVIIHALCRDCGADKRLTWLPQHDGPTDAASIEVWAMRVHGWRIRPGEPGATRCPRCQGVTRG